MTFALYRRAGAVVFLDDDPDYLEMIAQVMPSDWFLHLMVRPSECIDLLAAQTVLGESDLWRQQEIISQWRGGAALIPQILNYWRDDGTTRFGLTQVCVVDYSMPAMSGLAVLEALTKWPGARILLTGRADEQLAISAFNDGLIQQFITKQSPKIRQRLSTAIESLFDAASLRYDATWRATLSREQNVLLSDPAVSSALAALASQQGWVEHVTIGAPFGILALDSAAKAVWLQLEPPDRLPELAEMAESQGWDALTVEQVRSGQKLIDLELQLALRSDQPARRRTAFAIGPVPLLYGAFFDISALFSPLASDSYHQFLAGSRNRQMPD